MPEKSKQNLTSLTKVYHLQATVPEHFFRQASSEATSEAASVVSAQQLSSLQVGVPILGHPFCPLLQVPAGCK